MSRIIILNEDLESQMRMYLALCNSYRVEIAEDESTLMRMIRRKRPELVFLDASYSGYRGNGKSLLKTIEKIKKKYQRLKIITVLESDDSMSLDHATQNGSDAYIYRPIEELNVVESVRNQIRAASLPVN